MFQLVPTPSSLQLVDTDFEGESINEKLGYNTYLNTNSFQTQNVITLALTG